VCHGIMTPMGQASGYADKGMSVTKGVLRGLVGQLVCKCFEAFCQLLQDR
jgi:hypothetical protein